MFYTISIFREPGRTLVQTIDVRNGVDPSAPEGLFFRDGNSDGLLDLVVLGGQAEGGSWHKVWRFDASLGEFVWSHTTEPGEQL